MIHALRPRHFLLTLATLLSAAAPACAQDADRLSNLERRVGELERRVGVTPPPATQPTPPPVPPAPPVVQLADVTGLGVNLDANTDWATDARWVDLTRGFRAPEKLDGSALAALTPTGHAAEPAVVTFNVIARKPGTVYRLAWEGGATIAPKANCKQVAAGPGWIDLQPATDATVQLLVTPDPAKPITKWSMLDPNEEDPRFVFTARYRQTLSRFALVRAMQDVQTNHSPLTSWARRVTPDYGVQTSYRINKPGVRVDPRPQGCALEYSIAAANEAGVPLWACLADQLDDDGVRQWARTLKAGLAPDRPVYLEVSNEYWNPGFEQGQRLLAKAKAAGIMLPQQHAREHLRMVRLVREVWGADAGRLRFVVGTQVGSKDAWHAAEIFKEIAKTAGPVKDYVSLLTVAPYQTLPLAGRADDAYVQALIDLCSGGTWDKLLANIRLGDANGVAVGCYECGFADEGEPDQKLKPTVDRIITGHARMGDGLLAYDGWLGRHWGGRKFLRVHFTTCDPRWGLMPRIDQPGAKFDAAVKIAESAAR